MPVLVSVFSSFVFLRRFSGAELASLLTERERKQ